NAAMASRRYANDISRASSPKDPPRYQTSADPSVTMRNNRRRPRERMDYAWSKPDTTAKSLKTRTLARTRPGQIGTCPDGDCQALGARQHPCHWCRTCPKDLSCTGL